MLKLALPLVAAELGWMGMGVIDTVMAGHAGREMLGAVALGTGSTTRWRCLAWACCSGWTR